MRSLGTDELYTLMIIMLSVILTIVVVNNNSQQFVYSEVNNLSNENTIVDAKGDQINPDVTDDYVVWQDDRSGNWDIYLYDIEKDDATVIRTGYYSDSIICSAQEHQQTNPHVCGNHVVWQEEGIVNSTNVHFLVLYNISDGSYMEIYEWGMKLFSPDIDEKYIAYLSHPSNDAYYGVLNYFVIETGQKTTIVGDSLWYGGLTLSEGRCAIFERSNVFSLKTNYAYIIDFIDSSSKLIMVGDNDWATFKTDITPNFAIFTAYDYSEHSDVIIWYDSESCLISIEYNDSEHSTFSFSDDGFAIIGDCILVATEINYGVNGDSAEIIMMADVDMTLIEDVGIMRVNIGNNIKVNDNVVVYEYYDTSGDINLSMIIRNNGTAGE